MKDMGKTAVILGIKIQRYLEGIALLQSHSIDIVLLRFHMLEGNGVFNPFDPSVKLCKSKRASVSQLDYSKAIGCLMYIINCTRPDIAYAVSKLGR